MIDSINDEILNLNNSIAHARKNHPNMDDATLQVWIKQKQDSIRALDIAISRIKEAVDLVF